MDKAYITRLLQRYFTNEATHAEREALFAELDKHPNNADWEEMLTSLLPSVKEETYHPERYQSIIDKILKTEQAGHEGHPSTGLRTGSGYTKPTTPLRNIWRWVAAAAIIVMVVGGWWLVERRGAGGEKEVVAQTNDVPAPTNTRAVITLADGSKVYLDSAGNGTIAQENDVAVVKNNNGEIVYSSEKQVASSELVYNTLTNPRGSKVISLTLSDGTKVWLNAESSLRYPASFAAAAVSREVEITGEAYFEVKHNSKQPFKVHLPNGGIIEDIGTEFNINAYADESDIKTTLIEGSVQIFASSAKTAALFAFKLKPGEQAVISNPAHPQILKTPVPDINAIVAWRDNKFFFDGADIQTIARQLSRWYDVEVEVKDNIKEHFTGIINRDVKVSQVFDMLQKTGAVKFSVEGKKIIVSK